MAAAVSSSSSVWGVKSKPGAWALEAEQQEEDLQSSAPAALHPEPPSADFPTLATAAAATKNKKKKKPQSLSLAEFSTFTPSALKPSVADEPLALPTGPRERSAEELERSRSGFGGGFRSYGYDSANPRARVSERGDGNSTRDRSDEGLSRADEADDWSKAKKFSGVSGGDRREKVGFFNSSRADEVDNWASKKSFAPTVTEGRRERRMGFDTSSNGADSDNWTRAKGGRDGSASGPRLGFESSGAADSENWLKKKESNGGGLTAGRPRISLQPRTLPVISHINGGGVEVKPSSKGSNPFGDARPREEVLMEKGKDWKEIDEKLEAFKVKEEPVKEATNPWRRNDDLMGKKSWRKEETEIAIQPAVSVDKFEKGDAEDDAAENTDHGDAENN